MKHEHEQSGDRSPIGKYVFIGFALIAGYFLVTEHKAHLYGWLSAYGIWLLLLACPLMHVFMHHGHGEHGKREGKSPAPDRDQDSHRHHH